jgi:hypothetical protein
MPVPFDIQVPPDALFIVSMLVFGVLMLRGRGAT